MPVALVVSEVSVMCLVDDGWEWHVFVHLRRGYGMPVALLAGN
jgi:hypothetical protein